MWSEVQMIPVIAGLCPLEYNWNGDLVLGLKPEGALGLFVWQLPLDNSYLCPEHSSYLFRGQSYILGIAWDSHQKAQRAGQFCYFKGMWGEEAGTAAQLGRRSRSWCFPWAAIFFWKLVSGQDPGPCPLFLTVSRLKALLILPHRCCLFLYPPISASTHDCHTSAPVWIALCLGCGEGL